MILLSFLGVILCDTRPDSSLVEAGIRSEWTGKIAGPLIHIGTADGRFHCVNALTGDLIWSVDTGGPIFSSSATGTTTYIPSMDGFLFTFVPKYGYRRVPLKIRDLVFLSPFRTESGEFFASGFQTRLFCLDDRGTILSEYRSNSSIPAQGSQPFNAGGFMVVRVDYNLNVLDRSSQMVRFSDFDIRGGVGTGSVSHSARVTASFAGAITIEINGTTRGQLRIGGCPVSVFGSDGKFDFTLTMNGEPLSVDSVVFMDVGGVSVAVPSHPLIAPAKFEILRSSLPALAGSKGPTVYRTFSYGVHAVRRPFFDFSTFRHGADPTRPANQMVDQFDIMVVGLPYSTLPYWECALLALGAFMLVHALGFICRRLRNAAGIGKRIIIDPANPEIGTFCDLPCSIIRSENATPETFAVVHDMDIQGVVVVRGFQRLAGGELLIAYPRLEPLDFGPGFDPASFLNQVIRTLDGLFGSSYVHGSISEGTFFRDSTDSVLLGRLEESVRRSDDPGYQVRDIAAVARIVEAHLSDDQRDPLLIDLLSDMMCEDVSEVPCPREILRHPFFWEAAVKLALFKNFNDRLHNLQKPIATLFEAKRDQVTGEDWTVFIDRELFMDASHYTTYSGRHMRDLIRLIRNKSEHEPHDDRGHRLAAIGTTKEDYFRYFHQRFPNLFLYTYYFAEVHAWDCLPVK